MCHTFESSGMRFSFVNLLRSNSKVFETNNGLGSNKNNQHLYDFDSLLLLAWKKAEESGSFRYKLKAELRRVPGKYGFIIQLNKQRAQNRRPPQLFNSVKMPFDAQKFNFTKIKSNELLFEIKRRIHNGGIVSVSNGDDNPADVGIINISPFGVGHMLLVPRLSACRPQILTFDAVQLALEVQLLTDSPKFITVYNSMCAQASVNHLHVHSYFLAVGDDSPSSTGFDFISSPNLLVQQDLSATKQLTKHCYICECLPIPAFLFQVITKEDVDIVAKEVSLIVDYLVERNTAHNMVIVRAPPVRLSHENDLRADDCIRLYLWPRLTSVGAKSEIYTNVGACELAGHVFVPEDVYESATETDVLRLMSVAALPIDTFNSIVDDVTALLRRQNNQC